MNVIQEKLTGLDDFWDEKAQEAKLRRNFDNEINNLEGAVNLASKILALKGNAGWQEFLKALEDCRFYRRQELELSSGTDGELRILQGRCREIGAILSLMTQTEKNTEILANRLQGLKKEREAFIRPDGKVQPRGIS